MEQQDVVVDLAFPLTPGRVPIDHGYLLYSALTAPVPALHQATWLGIHPLSGRLMGDSLVFTRGSAVTLRLPASHVSVALALTNRKLRLGDVVVQLGPPTIRALEPAPSLFSWQVAIRLTNPPKGNDGQLDVSAFRRAFEAELNRQLTRLDIRTPPQILAKRQIGIKGQVILAFSVQLDDLTRDASIRLQSAGLGGKRRMGCGIFRPARPPAEPED